MALSDCADAWALPPRFRFPLPPVDLWLLPVTKLSRKCEATEYPIKVVVLYHLPEYILTSGRLANVSDFIGCVE